MNAGSLRTFVAAGCVAMAASGCASTRGRDSGAREAAVRASLSGGLGFSGTLLVNDLGQVASLRLRSGAARLTEGMVLLEDVHHRLHALDRGSLVSRWGYHGLDAALAFPTTSTGHSLLAMSRNRIHELDLTTGAARHGLVHFDMSPSAPFVASTGTAYIPSWGGGQQAKTLRTVNLATGLEGWGFRTTGDIRGAMAIAGVAPRQTVYFATDAGDVVAMPAAAADGPAPEPTWATRVNGSVTADLLLDGEDLFVACRDSSLSRIDRVTGAYRWATFLQAPLAEAPVATAGAVYQRNSLGLHRLDRATGEKSWTLPGGARFVAEREGKVVVQGADRTLATVDASGKIVARTATGGLVFLTNTRDGTLYGVGDDGFLVALQVGGE
jgi:outer membrane protein assembly factor BamB